MKRTILFFCTACLCFSLASRAEAQGKEQNASAGSPMQHAVKEYKAGEIYSLDDVVNLNADGNKLTVEVVQPKEGAQTTEDSLEVKMKVSGKLLQIVFTYGQENSQIALVVGQKRIAASDAYFTEEVLASAPESAVVVRGKYKAPDGTTIVSDTNHHPLVLRFQIPHELSKATKQLELKGVSIGSDKAKEGMTKYSLVVKLNDSATQRPSKPTPAQGSPSGDGTGKIEGMLVNADTKKPLPNVEIELSRADEGVPKNEKDVGKIKTDEKGQHSFSGLKPGKYLMSMTVKYFREGDRPCRPVGWFVVSARTADGGFVQIAMSNEIILSANQVSKMNLDLKCN